MLRAHEPGKFYKNGLTMSNHAFRKTLLNASLIWALSGLHGATAAATPECDPGNTQLAGPTENISNEEPTEAPSKTSNVEIVDLPDKINRIFDKLETASDVKYYSFIALRGQKVMINDVQRGAEGSHWKIEYNITGNWQTASEFESLITPPLSVGQKVQIRISHPTGVPAQLDKYFDIDFGSAPYAHNVRIEPEGPPTGTYFRTSTFRHRIMWATNIRDSTGQLLEGATVEFVINVDDQDPSNTVRSKRVTVTGGIVEYVDFPECSGRHMTTPFTGVFNFVTKWRAAYNTGHWRMSVRGNPTTGSSPVSITQVCAMKVVY
jgi:hypothetical protein